MPASRNVQIRLDETVWARYSDAAMARGRNLATHLRAVLEDDYFRTAAAIEALTAELAAIKERIADAQPGGTDADLRAMVLETLLLVRQRAQPAERRAAEGTVEAGGMKVWRPES